MINIHYSVREIERERGRERNAPKTRQSKGEVESRRDLPQKSMGEAVKKTCEFGRKRAENLKQRVVELGIGSSFQELFIGRRQRGAPPRKGRLTVRGV